MLQKEHKSTCGRKQLGSRRRSLIRCQTATGIEILRFREGKKIKKSVVTNLERLRRCLKRRLVANRNVGLRDETCLKPAERGGWGALSHCQEQNARTGGIYDWVWMIR